MKEILKIKDYALKRIERQIIEVDNLIQNKQNEIARLKDSNISAPVSSKYADFLAYRENLSYVRASIKEEENFLEMLKARRIDILKQYNIAKIDYEKINYLHLENIRQKLNQEKHREQLELDWIGGILHKNKEII